MLSTATLVLSRALEAALTVLGLLVFVLDDMLRYLSWWNLLALLYLAVRVARLWRAKREKHREDWHRRLLGRRSGLLFTLFASLVGIISALIIVVVRSESDGEAEAIALPAVVLAWVILHFGYAERYARAYFAALPARILHFPSTEHPTFADFAYFAFAMGTSFAASDVETRTSAIRPLVLGHSVLAFFYNTATLGVAIGVITGD